MSHNENLSYIGIAFIYKSQTGDDMMFAVVDSNQAHYDKLNYTFIYRWTEIEHEKYLKFYHELKRIRCLDDDEIFESYIEINILDKGNIVEKFQFKSIFIFHIPN